MKGRSVSGAGHCAWGGSPLPPPQQKPVGNLTTNGNIFRDHIITSVWRRSPRRRMPKPKRPPPCGSGLHCLNRWGGV